MRKVIVTVFTAGVLAVVVAGLASGATAARCGTLYTPACTPPTITTVPLTLVCHNAGATINLPTITVKSNSGIKKVSVTLGSKTIHSTTYSGRGPTTVTLSGLKIHTAGLSTGVHTITITTTDIRGKKAAHTLKFSICAPVPVFTG
jgi:hypothetical protein